jgi:hypothetical protein
MNEPQKARVWILQGLEIAQELKSKTKMRDAYEVLYKIDSIQGKKKEAFNHYKNFIHYRDLLMNSDNMEKIIQEQMKFDYRKRSISDSLKHEQILNEQRQKHQLKLEKQQSLFLLTLIILSGFAAVLILILFAFRAKRKAQKEIVRQKQVIEEKQKELLDSIYYAKRIQTALVTSEYYIRKELIRLKRR